MITVVVPTHNRTVQLSRLLKTLKAQILSSLRIEILIVSNVFEPATQKLVREFSSTNYQLKYLWVGMTGVNRARNKGLQHASHEVCLFLDDDCELHQENYFQKLLQLHQDHPHCIAIGGRYELGKKAGWMDIAYHLHSDYWLSRSKIDNLYSTNLIGGNLSVKKSLLPAEIRFDDQLQFGGAENSFNVAIIKSGGRLLLCDDLVVTHRTQLNLFGFVKKACAQGKGAFRNRRLYLGFFHFEHRNFSFEKYLLLTQRIVTWPVQVTGHLYNFCFLYGHTWSDNKEKGRSNLMACLFSIIHCFGTLRKNLFRFSKFKEISSSIRMGGRLQHFEVDKN